MAPRQTTRWGSERVDLAKSLVNNARNMEVNVREAKTHLTSVWNKVALGEEVVITKAGRPVAKLVVVGSTPQKRIFGSAKGELVVPDDFSDLPKEIDDLFYK